MQTLKLITALCLGASVAACGAGPDITTRNAPFETTPPVSQVQNTAQIGARQALPVTVKDIRISVPGTLTVSEANGYYPRADIVWRGDSIGNRHAQVAAIYRSAFENGTRHLNGPTGVIVEAEIVRFHSVTEKARYMTGGVHNMIFNLTVRRASTGEALAPTREITSDLPALGGTAAIEADRMGQTQKVRVTDHLSYVIQQELARFVTG